MSENNPHEHSGIVGYMLISAGADCNDINTEYVKSHFIVSSDETLFVKGGEVLELRYGDSLTLPEGVMPAQDVLEKQVLLVTVSLMRAVHDFCKYSGAFAMVFWYVHQWWDWELRAKALKSWKNVG